MPRPRNIVLLVADSLRWDSVHGHGDHRLPWLAPRAVRFDQARSAGCWTLPATASMFTGLLPHEHGATSQTRGIRTDVPTLAERMRALGYRTHMATANVATTHIFGLDRGFDTLDRVWRHVPAQHRKVHEALVLIGKPRLRRQILSKDFVMGKMSADLEASKVWLQSTATDVFDLARRRLDENEARNERSFLFLNLMEAHFPYHTASTFETSVDGIWAQLKEVYSLYHLVNQSWLTRGENPIPDEMLQVLRRRQRLAWERLAPLVDAFCEEMRTRYDALVVFAADHGDNFGEQGWQYHFANVNDAGNRIPLYWLSHERDEGRVVDAPVSARDLFGALLRAAGDSDPALVPLIAAPERSVPVLQSYWYNNRGRTLEQFRYNQFAFVTGARRFMHRHDRWYTAPITRGTEVEQAFSPLQPGFDPLHEGVLDGCERVAALRASFEGFQRFSAKVLARAA